MYPRITMGFKEFFVNWGKLVGIVIAFLAFPAVILGLLAAFGVNLETALLRTGQIVGGIYGLTGLIAGYIYSSKLIARKEVLKILKEKKLMDEKE